MAVTVGLPLSKTMGTGYAYGISWVVLYKECYAWGILIKRCCDSTCYGDSPVRQHYLYNTTFEGAT